MAENTVKLDDPYQVPAAELTETSAADRTTLFVVSKKKMILLFMFTFGMYSLVWFYENWKRIKMDTGSSIWPAPRAVFSIFFAHSLFKHIHKSASDAGEQVSWSYTAMAAAYIVMSILGHVAERMSDLAGALSLLLLPMILYVLWKVQASANVSQSDPQGTSNSRFTIANYVWSILGLLLWALVIIGLADILGLVSFDEMAY